MICKAIIEPKSDYIEVANSFCRIILVNKRLYEVSVVYWIISLLNALPVCGGKAMIIV